MPEPTPTCTLVTQQGSVLPVLAPLRFSFTKEAYTPFTRLTLTAPLPDTTDLSQTPRTIRFSLDGTLLHEGLVESVQFRRTGEQPPQVILQSKGMTSLLLQNELTPGLHPSVSLDDLMTSYYTFPEAIHWEADGDQSNYIFVREHSSLWEGIANLGYKLYGQYPHIRSANTVTLRRTLQPLQITLDPSCITAHTHQTVGTHLVSHLHMQDLNGTYDVYNADSPEAASMDIVRHKKLTFDRQYLRDPYAALAFRLAVSQEGWRSEAVTCIGYAGGDLCDALTLPGSFTQRCINGIRILGNASGITTTYTLYHDGFYP